MRDVNMRLSHFAKLLNGNNAVKISDKLIIFNDFELYDMEADSSKNYNSLDELIADNEDVKKIIEDAKYFTMEYDGGRGSDSGNKEMGGGFNHARGRKGGKQETIQNAVLNYGTTNGNSITSVLRRFRDKYGNADREYGAAVDELGYVYNIQKGGKTSVAINGNKGQTIVHNHPGGGNFSDSDLLSTAMSKEKGIIATGSNVKNPKTYHFQKNDGFRAKEFVKAVRNAKWPKKYSYDEGADWWLRKHQRTYGYKYAVNRIIGDGKRIAYKKSK